MLKRIGITDQIRAVAEGTLNRPEVCVAELKESNQSFIQSAVQATFQEDGEELERILKQYRKLRRAIASVAKTDRESLYYEMGVFNGTYRVFLDVQEVMETQMYNRKQQEILKRKHVSDILQYLYQNPNARQKSIAEGVRVQANYLSEILNKLMQAGYVERYGKNKGTQYCLTKTGRQIYRAWIQKNESESICIEVEYQEIKEKRMKERFLKMRSDEDMKKCLRKEEECGYAKWKADYRIDTATMGD